MENAKCYAPQILVGTEGLPREQWLEYRRKGIGGSDAAAVLGISPFRTGRDLYYDKLNIVTADDAENWVQLEVGTLLEPLVAKIFAHKTGYKIYRRPFMFQHPLYPWMLADLDYMVELPDGTTAILEIKTTNYNAKDNWWYNGEEIVPIYYESQGRHYMAVMNIDRVYFCCLYGNSEDEAMIRRIDRDMAYEEELIALERDFWENHVLTKTPPPYVEADGDLILESLRRKLGPADKDAPPVLLGQTQFGQLSMLLSLQEQKKALSADVSKLDKDIKRLKGIHVSDIDFILDRMSEQQVCNYLQRQKSGTRDSLRQIIFTWRDYLSMADKLGINTSDEIVYRVKLLRQRHDELVEQLRKRERDMEAAATARKYRKIAGICRSIKPKYEYTGEMYSIVVPSGVRDIMREGDALSHCVGKSDRYWERIEQQEAYILFLRKTAEIDKPYYTLEVEPNGTIRQKRTYFDRQNDDLKDAEKFLKEWQKVVSERLTESDREKAEKSKVLRLQEFEQLRQDDIRIHTGDLAGQRLVDVLVSDLMETAA